MLITLKIGELATQSGLSRDTLRFYEERGLIQSRRSSNGYRVYAIETLALLAYIKTAQQLGFSLAEIGENMPDLWHAPDPNQAIATLLTEKIQLIEARIAGLTALKAEMLARIALACPLQQAQNTKA